MTTIHIFCCDLSQMIFADFGLHRPLSCHIFGSDIYYYVKIQWTGLKDIKKYVMNERKYTFSQRFITL